MEHLEEWPTASWGGETTNRGNDEMAAKEATEQPEIIFKERSDRQNEMEIERANGIIKALRIRSEEKAERNRLLNLQIEEYKHAHKTDQAELQRLAGENKMLIDERKTIEEENERLEGELQKGNQYREGQKGTVLELHETVKMEKISRMAFEEENRKLSEQLRTAIQVIDYITKPK